MCVIWKGQSIRQTDRCLSQVNNPIYRVTNQTNRIISVKKKRLLFTSFFCVTNGVFVEWSMAADTRTWLNEMAHALA